MTVTCSADTTIRAARTPARAATAWLLALLAAVLLAVALLGVAPPAARAAFGVTENNFEAGTCIQESCTYASPAADFYTQAAGHPPFGITTFELNHHSAGLGQEPDGSLKRIRVDIPPGLAADPQALPACSEADFNSNSCPADTQVGTNELEVFASLANLTINGAVYNLEPKPGLPLDFGIDVAVEPLVNVHIFLVGHVDWSGDYHEYFEIDNIPREGVLAGLTVPLAVLKSKLIFNGRAGDPGLKNGNFLTLPSECSSSTTSHLEVESYASEISRTETHTPVGVAGCGAVPFAPTATVTPEPGAAGADQPDGATTVVSAQQNVGSEEINTADIDDAHVTLPAGMTIDPPAAHGLQACTAAQIAISSAAAVTCPAASQIGTVTIETDLPPHTLSGGVYLASPGGGTIIGPPYTIYLDAESVYGVSVRLQGSVTPNPATGRLEVTFTHNPQLPFSELILTLNGGARAPLANPLVCANAPVEALFTPYTHAAAALSSTPFAATGCASPTPPFVLTQSTQSSSAAAGAYTSYTFNLARPDGQQYLSQLRTVLPPGLVGAIPSVTLCGEPQAQLGSCGSASQIGAATVHVGAGSEPYEFSGPVFLTGPYNGAPYGLSIPVRAAAGPFDLGTIVTRAALNVDPYSGRIIATSSLPTIVGGIPLRLKNLSVAVNRPSFLFNPTSCGALQTESALTSTLGATQSLSSPFQVGSCNALAFKPTFTASTSARISKAIGAGLQVNLLQGAHQANIRSVFAQLPLQLPSRLTTLQKACPAATFAASPVSCRPLGSEVGTATVTTPVLPGRLTGSAYLVSHGGAAFPDLDLVLEDAGVRVILVGNTNIRAGITSSTFAAIPDVPVSSFVLNLPTGPHSALTANGSLCAKPLLMPTTITAQNGAQIKQSTRIAVSGCPVEIVSHRVRGNTLILKVRAFAAGRVSVRGGRDLRTVSKRLTRAATVTIKVPLSRGGRRALSRSRHGRLRLRVRVGFVPKQRGQPSSAASVTVTLRRRR